jgi:hypothetical protein
MYAKLLLFIVINTQMGTTKNKNNSIFLMKNDIKLDFSL